MADDKLRRYDKIDFLGEGQVLILQVDRDVQGFLNLYLMLMYVG